MSHVELLLDPSIRTWILVPLVIIALLVQVIHHYLFIYLAPDNTNTLEEIQRGQALKRSKLLRDNGGYIPSQGFYSRKDFMLNGEDRPGQTGIITKAKNAPQNNGNLLKMMSYMHGQTGNMLASMFNFFADSIIAGWIGFVFADYLI